MRIHLTSVLSLILVPYLQPLSRNPSPSYTFLCLAYYGDLIFLLFAHFSLSYFDHCSHPFSSFFSSIVVNTSSSHSTLAQTGECALFQPQICIYVPTTSMFQAKIFLTRASHTSFQRTFYRSSLLSQICEHRSLATCMASPHPTMLR